MENDLEKIRKIEQLISPNLPFVRVDLFSIVTYGSDAAYSMQNNQINGLKLARLPKDNVNEVMEIILSFKYLERLVFYPNKEFQLPAEIKNLTYLKYIALEGVVKLPKELFYKGLPLDPEEVPIARGFRKTRSEIIERLKIFVKYNPSIKIEIDDKKFTDWKNYEREIKEDFRIISELELFCRLDGEFQAAVLFNKGIFISGSSKIIDPPFEILRQGPSVILKYFEEKDLQGVERLYEAKIVIVGAGESGKTTLIRKLQDPNHPVPNAEDKRTEGIRVTTYPFEGITKYGTNVTQAHIWDFGGQELYHTTHQLFLTPDTLYILLNDNRKNDTDFYYWLNIVTLRAGAQSPILMVFNAKDNATRQIIPGEEIYVAFPNLVKNSIDVNFADKDITCIKTMKQTIEGRFNGLEVLGKPFPAYWVKVRDELATLSKEYINWNKFRQVCEKNSIDDIEQMKILAVTLHNLGVLLYFQEVFGLEDLIILKPQWCVDAIYMALDAKDIVTNSGRFNEKMLAKKWDGKRFAGNHLQLLKLMQHFDLCYKIEGTNDYIAPQLLPIEENKLIDGPSTWAITFQFDYVFMPAGLLTRLIARMSLYIKMPHAWRAGVVLEWEDGTIAEIIEHQLTHKIVIKINGPERRRRLLDIRKCLHELQKDFKGLKLKESVWCNCADCQKGGELTVFELKVLEDDAAHNEDVTCRNGTRKKIPAKNILDGLSYEDKPRIFISYSHQNESFKNEFRTMIAPLEKEGHWQVWDDRWLLPGDNWNNEIIRHLSEANVIVLMLTADFFKSDFIYDRELERAIQRHEAGDALLIGIIVSDCMWEHTPLSKIQMLPKDGVPIDRHQHRSEVWKTVAAKIQETILIRLGKINRAGGWNVFTPAQVNA